MAKFPDFLQKLWVNSQVFPQTCLWVGFQEMLITFWLKKLLLPSITVEIVNLLIFMVETFLYRYFYRYFHLPLSNSLTCQTVQQKLFIMFVEVFFEWYNRFWIRDIVWKSIPCVGYSIVKKVVTLTAISNQFTMVFDTVVCTSWYR